MLSFFFNEKKNPSYSGDSSIRDVNEYKKSIILEWRLFFQAKNYCFTDR